MRHTGAMSERRFPVQLAETRIGGADRDRGEWERVSEEVVRLESVCVLFFVGFAGQSK